MPALIETTRLTKFYGAHPGLLDLDLEVEQGEVFGLLGPNGAGKTTTIRLLLDFIKATSGTARVFGLEIHTGSQEIRSRTGYLPGDFTAYANLTSDQVFDYFSNLRQSEPLEKDRLSERFMLDTDRKIEQLSRGNRQKVGLIQAYMGSPDLLILDEPTTGLDPLLQVEFQDLVLEQKAAGKTQFISSHQLPEVEAICDRVGIIRDGRLVALETMAALRARARMKVTITLAEGDVADAAPALGKVEGVSAVKVSGSTITLRHNGEIDPIIKVTARFTVRSFESQPPALDEVFMAYYNGEASEPDDSP
jgi:ABC-2 type transport system ATP-binding protein